MFEADWRLSGNPTLRTRLGSRARFFARWTEGRACMSPSDSECHGCPTWSRLLKARALNRVQGPIDSSCTREDHQRDRVTVHRTRSYRALDQTSWPDKTSSTSEHSCSLYSLTRDLRSPNRRAAIRSPRRYYAYYDIFPRLTRGVFLLFRGTFSSILLCTRVLPDDWRVIYGRSIGRFPVDHDCPIYGGSG